MRPPRIDHFRWINYAVIASLAAIVFGADRLPSTALHVCQAIFASSLAASLAIILFYVQKKGGADAKLTEEETVSIKQLARKVWWIALAAVPLLFLLLERSILRFQ